MTEATLSIDYAQAPAPIVPRLPTTGGELELALGLLGMGLAGIGALVLVGCRRRA